MFFWTVVILGIAFVAAHFFSKTSESGKPTGFNFTRPITVAICPGQFEVQAGSYRSWTLNITPNMLNAHLVGSFQAGGGSGNDIQAVVADQMEFQNWINGHPARVLYSTPKMTTGRIDVHLPPGTYILAFNNRFSLLSDKQIVANVELQYL